MKKIVVIGCSMDVTISDNKSYIVRATKNNLITERTINIIFAS
jgi:hypothetical protein